MIKPRTNTQMAFDLFITAAKRHLTDDEWKAFKAMEPEFQTEGFVDAYHYNRKPRLLTVTVAETEEEALAGETEVQTAHNSADIKAWKDLERKFHASFRRGSFGGMSEALGKPEPSKPSKVESGIPIPMKGTAVAVESGVPIPPMKHKKHKKHISPSSPRALAIRLSKANIGDSVLLKQAPDHKVKDFTSTINTLFRAVGGSGWFTSRTINKKEVRVWKTGEPPKK